VWLNSGASKRRAAPLTKCSLTVAVTQQSWRNGNLYPFDRADSAAAADRPCFRVTRSRAYNLTRSIQLERSIHKLHQFGITARRRAAGLDLAGHARVDTCSAGRQPCSRRSRHFCAAGTFCTRFRHARNACHACAVGRTIVHRRDETTLYAICRRRFDRRTGRTEVLTQRPQSCLSRHHIAPTERKSAACGSSHGPVLLFFLRMRVRSHASRLARAHHFTIPKIRGDRLYFVGPLNKRFE